jgi:Zn-dependent membrane protease YugP
MTRSTFARYSRVRSAYGLTGEAAARAMLRAAGVHDVTIEPVPGHLTDHYDPRSRTLRLSEDVYHSTSLAAMGVACHEAGHALQHSQQYAFLWLRSAFVPVVSIGSNLYMWVILIGMFMRAPALIMLGVLMLVAVVLFALITLPVEWNATARAKRAMVGAGIVSAQEVDAAGQVLNAAFLTYVASAVTAILTLLYYLVKLGLLGGRRDD